jgi:hypothetical protein
MGSIVMERVKERSGMKLHASTFWSSLVLLVSFAAQAQDIATTTSTAEAAAAGRKPEPQSSAVPQTPARQELDTAVQSFQLSLPAGVCPVITDYLFQQCQQNPADPMCAPAEVN